MIANLAALDCAYTIWRFLEERFPNYSLQNLDEILHKSIALSKMNSNDPKFGDCLFKLRDLMRANEMLESLATSFLKSLEFIKMSIVVIIYLMNHSLWEMINCKMMLNMDTMMRMRIVILILKSL